jgi:hypothetical protein
MYSPRSKALFASPIPGTPAIRDGANDLAGATMIADFHYPAGAISGGFSRENGLVNGRGSRLRAPALGRMAAVACDFQAIFAGYVRLVAFFTS